MNQAFWPAIGYSSRLKVWTGPRKMTDGPGLSPLHKSGTRLAPVGSGNRFAYLRGAESNLAPTAGFADRRRLFPYLMAFQFSTYKPAAAYKQRVAYFSMEFALDQALKTYSGGLGFLAGSHMRSAYDLKQNVIGVGILWSFGYYDQARNEDQTLRVDYTQKAYSFLEDTGVTFPILIHDTPVYVKAYFLNPETFGTAPMLFLTTDLPENDYLSRTISHHLYDAATAAVGTAPVGEGV